jgi:hypothetical protein
MSAVAKIKDKSVADQTGTSVELVARNTPAAMTPMEMLNSAIARGDSLDKLERLMDLNDRWERSQAKKAFIEAKAAFKANAPAIAKDKTNTQYKSKYASIGNVVNTVNEALSKHGLDADWQFDQSSGIKVTCTLTHVAGHSESVSLVGTPDASGSKNPLQQIKSTLTYLKLATFEAVTGIATREGNLDDDGNASGASGCITDAQADELLALIQDSGSNPSSFLKIAGAETVSDILAKDFEGLKKVLLAKKKNGAGQ